MGRYYGMVEDSADEQRARDAYREANRLKDEEENAKFCIKIKPYFITYGIFWLIVAFSIAFKIDDSSGVIFLWVIIGFAGFLGLVELLNKMWNKK